jgi:flagellar protein FlaF
MQNAARTYGQVARETANPRELEASLLLQAASRLQAVHDDWDIKKSELAGALLFNRKLWSIFLTSMTDNESPLPAAIRQNVANLGVFVLKQTLTTMSDPRPDQLNSLININREIAAGLLAKAA